MGRGPSELLQEGGREALDRALAGAIPAPPPDPPSESSPKTFKTTDLGNAERLVHRSGNDLRYVATWGRWMVSNGARWRLDETGEVIRRATDMARAILDDEARQTEALGRREELARWSFRSESAVRIAAAVELARTREGIAITHEELDRNPWLFNVENGTLDLRTGELRPHSRGDLITKIAPVPYDPAAVAPLWLKTVERSMSSKADMVTFLQRAFGYALTGTPREQALFFFYGEGANGKSTLLELLMWLWGGYATAGAPDLLLEKNSEAHPTELTDLHGARLVVCQEAKKGRRWDEALLKRLTGCDRIKARRMREDFWEFDPTHKLFISANHKPVVRGTDHAIWRRIKLVPFLSIVPDQEQDRELPNKLRAEGSGILRWLVEGCLAWQRDGLNFPDEVLEATAAYRREQDALGSFFADRCKLHERERVSRADLRKAYEAWCEELGEKPASSTVFTAMVRERKIAEGSVRSAGSKSPVKGWHGLGLKTDLERTMEAQADAA